MTDRYVLRFSNNIIEHLGVKLYQNKPTNVIAEYIANSWDAGAENVDVTIRNSSQPNTSVIAITDDGEGMTRDILLKRFLVIGVKFPCHWRQSSPLREDNRCRQGPYSNGT